MAPPTPGPATFALQAFRTGLFGTPAPPKVSQDNIQQRSDKKEAEESKTFKSKTGPERLLDFRTATPSKKVAPQGILLTPGTALNRKKSVAFVPDDYDDTVREFKSGRVRSGLPSSYPGKFPSPWTPKVVPLS